MKATREGDEDMVSREIKTVEDNRYIELAKQCIGLDRNKPYARQGKRFYRPTQNRFRSKANNEDWELLELVGYAKHWMVSRDGFTDFRMTRAGLDWLGKSLGIHIYDEEEQE